MVSRTRGASYILPGLGHNLPLTTYVLPANVAHDITHWLCTLYSLTLVKISCFPWVVYGVLNCKFLWCLITLLIQFTSTIRDAWFAHHTSVVDIWLGSCVRHLWSLLFAGTTVSWFIRFGLFIIIVDRYIHKMTPVQAKVLTLFCII